VRPRSLLVLVLVIGPIAAACGSDAVTSADDGPRTVEIEMRDIAFAPDRITVPAGEEVRLVFRNTGKVDHDAFIGDEIAQVDHEEEMASGDSDMRHGDDGDAVTVEPGETGTLTHTFEAGEEVLIGCHQPGHYDGGMKMTVTAS
jgi:uncharacterized cupredoxin-like copper-binding protein